MASQYHKQLFKFNFQKPVKEFDPDESKNSEGSDAQPDFGSANRTSDLEDSDDDFDDEARMPKQEEDDDEVFEASVAQESRLIR